MNALTNVKWSKFTEILNTFYKKYSQISIYLTSDNFSSKTNAISNENKSIFN